MLSEIISSLNMITQTEVVEQIMQKLAFEVEAVPRNKSDHVTSVSKSTPLNVKIRVRKKDEDTAEEYVTTTTKHMKGLQRVRLVSSDQTILNFDVFMEAEFEKKPPPKKIRKQIFEMLKPGVFLGALEDDDYTHIPSSSYNAPSQTTKSDGTLKHTFTLSKNVYQDYTVSTQSGEQKYFFGKCKPGGCLDPPFSEDTYSYKPTMKPDPKKIIAEKSVSNKEKTPEKEVVESDTDGNKQPILRNREDSKNGRHSSIFDGSFFKRKPKSSEQSTNTQPPEQKDSVVNIFQGDPLVNSTSGHSNSIITYPPKMSSDLKVNEEKVKSRSPSEDKPRKSFNEHSESYFIPPKGMSRDKDNDKMNQNETKRRSSDKNAHKGFKFPGIIPVPIPIPIPSTKPDSENNAPTDQVLATNDNKNTKDLNLEPSKHLPIEMKSVGTQTSLQLQDSSTGDTAVDSIQSFKVVPLDVTDVGQPPNKDADTESKSPNTDDLQKQESKELSNPRIYPIVPVIPIPKDSNLEKSESTEHDVVETMPEESEPEKDIKSQSSNDNQEGLNKDNHPLKPIPTDIINENEAEGKTNELDMKQKESEQSMLVTDNMSTDSQKPLYTDTSDGKARESIPEDITQPYIDNKQYDESRDSKIDLDENKNEKSEVFESDTDTANDLTSISSTEPTFESEKEKDEIFPSGNGKDYVAAPLIIEEITTPPDKDANNKKDSIDDHREESKDNITDQFPTNIPPKLPKIPKEKFDSPDECVLPVNVDNNVKIITKPPKVLTERTDSNDNSTNEITKSIDTTSIPILSPDQSANTVRSALKKDYINVELGFYSRLNDKNERVITTFDTKHVPTRSPNDLVTIVKSQIRISSNEIRIPVDAEHDMSIQIKKPNQRVSINESKFLPDNVQVTKPKSIEPNDGETISPKTNKSDEGAKNGELEISIIEFYEQELIPLQLIIRNLRDEIDVLAAQQSVFKDKIFCTNKTKTRAPHSNKKCFGCLKK
ncbi:unnamed protein product [Spodoptera littoralis]|uniref:Uncharacterized protein n=1 Tax=Spodoptera littoralis TaxID=7109 RepID=A0A9P0IK47_SPOLI|nr:unnamed protein product [Spodoptera littoralis]CAH1646506.1 unnamed protein product [Spodoptera littoralis]